VTDQATENQTRGQILDGRALSSRLRERIAERVQRLSKAGIRVRLDAVLVEDEQQAATVYAQSQGRACEKVSISYHLHEIDAGATYDDVAGRVLLLSSDPQVSAIMVHLPLPDGVDSYEVQQRIAPQKDVEGVNPANIGNVIYGRESLAPCTALAALTMIESTGIDLRGVRVCVVGASNIVGKPLAALLMQREATVVSCNKHTVDMEALTREADVLVAAAGVPGLITAPMVKNGAIVIDVGTTQVAQPDGSTKLTGDVDFEHVREKASWITPVPGGVGPVTVSVLLQNVVRAAERAAAVMSSHGEDPDD